MEDQPQTPHATESGELRRLRTYQSDVEEALKKGGVSLSKIALAESEKKRNPLPSTPLPLPAQPKIISFFKELPTTDMPGKNRLPVLLWGGGVVLLFGISAVLFWIFSDRQAPPPITEVPAEGQRRVTGEVSLDEHDTRARAMQTIRKAVDESSVPLSELRVLAVKIGGRPITTVELFQKLGFRAPDTLARALGPSPTLGLHGSRGVQPFLLFTVTSFDHAFDAMLRFEETLLDDVGPLFGVNPRALSRSATTTEELFANTFLFKDVIIKNKDARAIFDDVGQIVFLYSFLDKETLLLTTNEETLKTLVNKVSRGQLK